MHKILAFFLVVVLGVGIFFWRVFELRAQVGGLQKQNQALEQEYLLEQQDNVVLRNLVNAFHLKLPDGTVVQLPVPVVSPKTTIR